MMMCTSRIWWLLYSDDGDCDDDSDSDNDNDDDDDVQVYQQKYPPPLIPPRGEVNAADAFDIGSFDEEDTKGLKLTEADQELYKNFPLVISERWQNEVRTRRCIKEREK